MEDLLKLIGQVDNIAIIVLIIINLDMRRQLAKMIDDQSKLVETLIGMMRPENHAELVVKRQTGKY